MKNTRPVLFTHIFRSQAFCIAGFCEIDSTNTYLKKVLSETPDLIVTAERQSAGRGRHSRRWANTGRQLMFSFAVRHNLRHPPLISVIAGCALFRAFSPYISDLWLKWPNDLYRADRKTAGILCEHITDGQTHYAVIGMGINISGNMQDLPEDIRHKADFLMNTDDDSTASLLPDFNDLMCGIVSEAEGLTELGMTEKGVSDIVQEWKLHSRSLGRMLRVDDNGKIREGTLADIDNDGFIVLACADGQKIRIISGDVEFI